MEQIATLGIAVTLAVGGVLGPVTSASSAAPSSPAVPSSSTAKTSAQPVTLGLSFETLQKAEYAGKMDEIIQFTEIEDVFTYFERLSPQEILEFAVDMGQYVDDGNAEMTALIFVYPSFDKKVLPLLTFADLEHLTTAGALNEAFQYVMIEMMTCQYDQKRQLNPPEIDELFAKVATDPAHSHVIREKAAINISGKGLATKILIEKYDELEDKEKGQVYLRRLKNKDKEAYGERLQVYEEWKKSRRRGLSQPSPRNLLQKIPHFLIV